MAAALEVTNTLGRAPATLVAPTGRPLTLYCCGPTVYRYAHVGNLRTFLLADLVRRVLRRHGVAVRAVQNITDVGHLADDTLDRGRDKLLLAAELEGRSAAEIAEHYTTTFLDDSARLNLLPFDVYPRASQHVAAMIALTERLLAAGHAYEADSAVYFDVGSFPAYGRLSGNRLTDLRPGHRGEPHPDKRFHGDFALWRKAGPRRQMTWSSPWGRGFPGWHVECSAMGLAYLGERIDVHLGGVDLVVPHHECELAQSEAATGHQVVRVWLHGEHLLADGRKMSKSAGNVHDLRGLQARGVEPLAFRLLCLQWRYRSQCNVTWEALAGAQRTLQRLRARTAALAEVAAAGAGGDGGEAVAQAFDARFDAALGDDLDTPAALRLAHAVASGDAAAGLPPARRWALLAEWDAVLGLDLQRDDGDDRPELPAGAAERITARERARAARDWTAADRLRDELDAQGVVVVDTPVGTRWTVRP